MKKSLLIIALFLTFISECQLLTFENINHKNGLVLSSILSISQDKNGYIWIGTDGAGLQRYNGKPISKIKVDENDEHHVTSIEPHNDGIYFSSRYYGYFLYANNKIKKLTEIKGFGENLNIKKLNKTFCFIGQWKILLKKGKKLVQEYIIPIEKRNNSLVQIIKINNSVLVIGDVSSYFINENSIVELNTWLNNDGEFKANLGTFANNRLELFDFNSQQKLLVFLNSKTKIFSIKKQKLNQSFDFLKETKIVKAFNKRRKLIFLDSNNEIYQFKNGIKYIPKNFHKQNFTFFDLFIDINDDYWATTSNNGIFKISDEPFTKIELHSVYQNPLISFIYRTKNNEVILSDFNIKTYISSYTSAGFKTFDFRIYQRTYFQEKELFATNKGIFYLKDGEFLPFKDIPNSNKIIYIFGSDDNLFFCEENKGLHIFNSKTKKTKQIIGRITASHIYTSQINKFKTKIYFGTNNGIYEYDLKSEKLRSLNSKFNLTGSYSGVSVTDIYGTMWFSLEKKLIGITQREDYIEISDKKHFNSTIFYNLNADKYGNLIIGTNIGISKLKIDYLGNVIQSTHYNNFNGFHGYETHMRSNFQDGKFIYIGTIEGVFSINTEILERLPNPPSPLIFQNKEKDNLYFNSDEELIKINYLAINPKLNGIRYSYRLKGKSIYWSDVTNKTEAYFSNLSDQEYIFQVKSTFDGLNFSPTANYKIYKETPIWKSKWFILFLVLTIALANIIVLDRSKSFEISQVIENQNIEISSKIKSILLGFGLIAVSCSHFFAGYIDDNLSDLKNINIAITLILFVLFVFSITRHPFEKINKYLINISLIAILAHSYLGAYLSNIHPIFVVIISLLTAVTPFALNRIRDVIIFSVFQIICVVSVIFLLENTIYNEILFLIAVIVSVSLSIFTTYIRNESLQKLIFISDVINKGNIIAIAFNQENKITYISDNSFEKLNIKTTQYLNKNISQLNVFIDFTLTTSNVSFETSFQDNVNKIVIPMRNPQGKEIWIEWSCETFSKSIKVIFGQDVSDRINIENNYESLIENAEDLIYTVDINGDFLFANTMFQNQLGYNETELIGRNSSFIVSQKYEEQTKLFFEKQFKEKILNTYYEFPIRKKDGTEIWIGQNTTMLFAVGSKKIIKGFLSLARDITEKREQQKLIEEQNENITSSITYAKKIQFNLLPHKDKFEKFFSEHEIFFQAKDIVSGDFFWLDEADGITFLVIGDCTGHGVPGSFMTLLGINLLNQIILEDKISDPSEILSNLDEKLVQVLPREGNSSVKDGIEMTIIAFDLNKKIANYACAGGKFITIQNKEIIIQRGESKHIGDVSESNFSKYNTYNLDLSLIETLYFFTDGIQDQFGGSSNKKFTIKRILDLLKKNQDLDLKTNVAEIKLKVNSWKNKLEQTDDITFIGVKL